MRTALTCFLILALTLTGNEVARKHPATQNQSVEEAQYMLESQKYKNILLLRNIENQIEQYELREKTMESSRSK